MSCPLTGVTFFVALFYTYLLIYESMASVDDQCVISCFIFMFFIYLQF